MPLRGSFIDIGEFQLCSDKKDEWHCPNCKRHKKRAGGLKRLTVDRSGVKVLWCTTCGHAQFDWRCPTCNGRNVSRDSTADPKFLACVHKPCRDEARRKQILELREMHACPPEMSDKEVLERARRR